MGFRTVVIKNRCKLEYSLNYLICRKSEEVSKVLISEIDFLMIANTGVALTAALVVALIENKVKIIFCDGKANPCGEIVSYYDNYSNYRKIKDQMDFAQITKGQVWQGIIKRKILMQRNNLLKMGCCEEIQLLDYSNNVEIDDASNREGHAAKVYFNALFSKNFSRKQDNDINKYLNYGYSIILSAINREIKICGYLTELGIHHIGETNPFNLSCDFMETLRPLVDLHVITEKVGDENFKDVFINMLNLQVKYSGNTMYLENAIRLHVQSLLKCLSSGDTSNLAFIDYEL